MIWRITKKNFIITSKFIVGTLLIILLKVIITWLQIDRYAMKLDAYNFCVQKNEENLGDVYVYSEIQSVAVKPPEIMSIFSQGTTGELGDHVGIMMEGRLVMVRTRQEFLENDLEKIYLDYMQEVV